MTIAEEKKTPVTKHDDDSSLGAAYADRIKGVYDYFGVFDIRHGNLNGDPAMDSQPKMDHVTGQALISRQCMNRLVRNRIAEISVDEHGNPLPGHLLYIADDQTALNEKSQAAYDELGVKRGLAASKQAVFGLMCDRYIDMRLFGGGPGRAEYITCLAPVQNYGACTIDPVAVSSDMSTRMTPTQKEKADEQREKGGEVYKEIGRSYFISYGLFAFHGRVSAHSAAKTGMTNADLELYWEVLRTLFYQDLSAARGKLRMRKLYVFDHNSERGRFGPADVEDFFDIKLKPELTTPAKFDDYDIEFLENQVPEGVTTRKLV